MSFASMSVAELREQLSKLGVSEDEINAIKGKANLVYALKQFGYVPEKEWGIDSSKLDMLKINNSALDSDDFQIGYVDTETPSNPDTSQNNEEKLLEMMPTHPEWTKYVMSHFAEDELFEVNGNKYPSVAGLRRVTELLLGDILYSKPVECIISHPNQNNPLGCASVRYEICILWKLGMPCFVDSDSIYNQKIFGGMGGSNEKNTDDNYAIYPEQIAETRAEGRALRKALGLKNIIAIEEITGKDVKEIIASSKTAEWSPLDKINSNQKAAITTLCDRFNIDLIKFINSGINTYSSIEEISKDTAAKMIQELSRYQNSETEKEIPEGIKKNA